MLTRRVTAPWTSLRWHSRASKDPRDRSNQHFLQHNQKAQIEKAQIEKAQIEAQCKKERLSLEQRCS